MYQRGVSGMTRETSTSSTPGITDRPSISRHRPPELKTASEISASKIPIVTASW